MRAVLVAATLLSALAANVGSADTRPSGEAVQFEHVQYTDRLERDGRSTRTLDFRVRLGTAQGVAQFGQIGMPYLEGLGDVQFQDVVIQKPDGRRVDVKDGLVEDVNPLGVSATGAPADIRYKKLTLAALEPGDVLSYKIVHRQQPVAPGRVFGEFTFPSVPDGPPQTYELDLPRAADITIRLRKGLGAAWQDVPSPQDRRVRRLTLKVDPSAEDKAGERDENQPDVTFTSFRSWNDLSSWWWGISKERMRPDASIARQAADVTSGAVTVRDKVAALFAFVAGRVRYVNVSFRLGRLQPRPAADVLKARYGDCKDKHALLAALAEAVGVDVRPVLVDSAGGDLREEAPGPQQFDHLISVVRLGAEPSEWLWLDSTNPFGAPGYLLPPLRDQRALLVEADGAASLVRTPMEPPFVPRHEVSLEGTLDTEGVLRARMVELFRSDTEILVRALMSSLPAEKRASEMLETVLKGWANTTVREVSFSDPLDTGSPFRLELELEAKPPAGGTERTLTLLLPETEPPKAADRVPAGKPRVEFEVRELVARARIQAAEGQTPRAPLSVSLERPFGTFRSTYLVDGREMRMERVLKLRQGSIGEEDLAAYEAFRATVATDRKQAFAIQGVVAPGGAAGLLSEGLAAFEKKDYARAVELLRKAGEADPKTKDVFEDLGRALHELRRYEEAVGAFTRQIEMTPFHESAYAWKAYALLDLGRGEEAEKALLKQIEVAPFKPWSYEKLGERRMRQGRPAEAADFYARAAAIEPAKAERWIDLGGAQVEAKQAPEGRRSLERALSLNPSDWMKVRAAWLLRSLGEVARAGELAQAALPSIRKRLAELTRETFDADDEYWMERLAEIWLLVGEAAAAAGDSARARSYLQAAWGVSFSPEAGWALGELREKEGRVADAVELWTMAATLPYAKFVLPADHQTRIDDATRKLGRPASGAGPRLTELRTVRLGGAVSTDLTREVLLLIDALGGVQAVLDLSGKDPKAFDRQISQLGPIRAPWTRPDQEPVKVIRRALLVCATVSGCSLVFDLPGTEGLNESGQGSIRIVSLEPKDGTVLAPGQQVDIVATVHYELEPTGRVVLAVQDDAGPPSPEAMLAEATVRGSGEATLRGRFTVPAAATRIAVFLLLGAAGPPMIRTFAHAAYTVRR